MLHRRPFLAAACALAAATTLPVFAQGAAGAFPTKPVTLIAPTVPGGALDAVARVLAQHLGPKLGQPVVVESRPGVGGTLGVIQAAKAPADGHTLVLAADAYLTVSPRMLKGAALQPMKDLVPVIEVGSSPMVLVAHPSLNVRSMADYIAKVRAEPGTLTYASAGVGSPHHLNMALLEQMAGLKQNHVSYKGGPQAFNDVLGGHAQAMFISMSTADPHIKSGKLIALGVSGKKRLPEFPSVPAIAETVPGYESEFWFAVYAPAATPAPVVDRLNRDIAAVVAQPEVAKGLKAAGMTPVADTSTKALAEKLKREDAKMAHLIQSIGLRPE